MWVAAQSGTEVRRIGWVWRRTWVSVSEVARQNDLAPQRKGPVPGRKWR